MVHKLIAQHKREGASAYLPKKAGRPSSRINPLFAEKVIALRKETDYGSEKLHFSIKKEGFNVSQRQIQKILDTTGLTEPCVKRRGQRSYVRYEWPISNYMWHCDWTDYQGRQICAFIDDKSRKIMAAAEFTNATEKNAMHIFYQATLMNGVSPIIILSDKGSQFYANKRDKTGQRAICEFEQELGTLNIKLWTSRRNHPQTNGKMEKWFDTLKKRMKKHPEETLQDLVKWYNQERIHHALAYKTPDEIYQEAL